jgi:2-dehydropantoate 2-reductase
MQTSPLTILTFGAGAIGTYIGGSLALAGHMVVFVERPAVVEELRQRGLRLDLSVDRRRQSRQAFVVQPTAFVAVASLEDALKFGPFDLALFALKSFDTAPALEGMRPFAAKLPPILCLSNGVENELLLSNALGAEKVIYGTVTSAVGRRAAGDVVLEKLRGVGIAAGHPLSTRLVSAFQDAYLNARLYPDALSMKWSKMLTNLIANATSAILDMTPAEIYAHPALYRLEMRMLAEALAVMKASKIDVVDLPATPVRLLARLPTLPAVIRPLARRFLAGGRGGKMPSFHIDLHSGRGQSEVEWLNGAVVRQGEKVGIPAPVNGVLTQTLLSLTRGEIPLETFARRPDQLLKITDEAIQSTAAA